MSKQHMFTDATDALNFILAGKSVFTLVSLKTGTRFTYRVKKKGEVWFVSVMNGRDNEINYGPLGMIKPDMRFIKTRISEISETAPCHKAFVWTLVSLITTKEIPITLQIWHEGKCGVCARRLTVPTSIENGIGPECAKKNYRCF